jgi:hypothetical protein
MLLGGRGGPRIIFFGILLFLLLRSPCKYLEPYDNPFWGFEQRWQEKEERGYIAGRVRLYCRKSAVIFPEERGYIAGRVRLYCRKSAVIFPEECGYIFVLKIVAYLSCSAGRTHFARTNYLESKQYAQFDFEEKFQNCGN